MVPSQPVQSTAPSEGATHHQAERKGDPSGAMFAPLLEAFAPPERPPASAEAAIVSGERGWVFGRGARFTEQVSRSAASPDAASQPRTSSSKPPISETTDARSATRPPTHDEVAETPPRASEPRVEPQRPAGASRLVEPGLDVPPARRETPSSAATRQETVFRPVDQGLFRVEPAAAQAASAVTTSAVASGPAPSAPTGVTSSSVAPIEASGRAGSGSSGKVAVAKPTPRAAPESRVAEQVTRGMTALLAGKGGRVTIKLSPAELGAVRINLDVRDGVVTATFEASDASARKLLTRQLDQLRAAIETRGMRVERLEVEEKLLPASPEATERDGTRGTRDLGQSGARAEDRGVVDRDGSSEDGPTDRRDGSAGEPGWRQGAAQGRAVERPDTSNGGAATDPEQDDPADIGAEASDSHAERGVRLRVDVVA